MDFVFSDDFVNSYMGGPYFGTNLRATCKDARNRIGAPKKRNPSVLMHEATLQEDARLFLLAASRSLDCDWGMYMRNAISAKKYDFAIKVLRSRPSHVPEAITAAVILDCADFINLMRKKDIMKDTGFNRYVVINTALSVCNPTIIKRVNILPQGLLHTVYFMMGECGSITNVTLWIPEAIDARADELDAMFYDVLSGIIKGRSTWMLDAFVALVQETYNQLGMPMDMIRMAALLFKAARYNYMPFVSKILELATADDDELNMDIDEVLDAIVEAAVMEDNMGFLRLATTNDGVAMARIRYAFHYATMADKSAEQIENIAEAFIGHLTAIELYSVHEMMRMELKKTVTNGTRIAMENKFRDKVIMHAQGRDEVHLYFKLFYDL